MSLEFKHFDTRLNQWIHTDGDNKNPQSILTEKLDNTLLEFYFPGKEFSFGHLDEYSTSEDLRNHPDGHTLLLSSKTRLLYGSPECLEVIEKLCPDRKDRGAYGSIFLGGCKNAINEELNILVVDDSNGENGGVIDKEDAYKLVGDCYGQVSIQLYDKLTNRVEQQDKSYRVIQHRFGWTENDGQDTKYRFGKGTLRPYGFDDIKYTNPDNKPKIDIIIPLSSFKGTDKDRPGGAIKPQIQPGLYRQKIWLGEKSQSERGKTAISQLLASFPQGIKDFAEELEAQAQKLAESQSDPRKVAQLFCEKYEKRKAFTEEQKASLEQQITEQVADGSLVKQLELLTWNETEEQFEPSDDLEGESEKDDLLMYKFIKADLVSGHNQILETEKVRKELAKFVQGEWRDIALGRTLTFDRAMIIPSKELKNGEICVPWLDKGEKVLNFRSPFLNSNGLCVSTNKIVDDCLAPDGTRLEGIIIVNDEDLERIKARLQPGEIAPRETESERQGRDFDGDCIGVALAKKYPNLTAEAEYRNQPENAYAPTVKEKKQSFYINGEQPPFEQIAIHMSDGISVGVINNQVTALEALESEIEILNIYGTSEQKTEYLDRVLEHYEKLLELENIERPLPIREEYKPYIQKFVALAQNPDRMPEIIEQAMNTNRQLYRSMIEEACYHNQIAVDLFKSSRKPEMGLIKENNRYLYRQVDYIKDKKSPTAYLNSGIKTEGYSPVELLINQTNKYFQESQLESRPIVQFSNLFQGVEFTPQQRFAAISAKYEFDKLYNAAVAMERRRSTEKGPSAIIETQQGTKLEITNLLRYKHPGIWKAESINLKLEKDKNSNRLLALAQIDNELDDNGQPKFRRLGTVSPQSIEEHGLKPGMSASNAKLVEFKPELTKGQTRLMFSQAYKFAEEFRQNIPEQERLSAAAAAWNVGAARQDELEEKQSDKSQIQKKTPNFVFAAFSEEIISRLGELQFTDLRVGTLGSEANNFKGKEWSQDDKYSVEIRASDHPPGHDRHASRLVFVQDSDGEFKEFAALEPRTAHLPIGTKAQANILPGETSTAKATVSVPGKEPVEFTIREIKKFSHADRTFHGESVTLEIGKVPVPTGVVKIKLDGKTLGELDADSIKQLQAINYLADGKPLNLKLTTISEKHNAFVIAESPNGNFIKIDKTNSYDYQGQKFNDTEYRRLTLEVPQSQVRDAVFLNGEPLGVVFFNKDKEVLKNLGVLKFGQLTPVNVTLQSNFTTTMVVKVDPDTVEYPENWTKENLAFGQQTVNEEQHRAIAKTAPMLYKIKERPTMLFATPEDKMLGLTQLAVDNHKIATVTKWLADKNIAISQVPPEDVPIETKKGLAVFNIANSSIPPLVFESMTKKFGSVIESRSEYEKKVRSLPDRPKHLKPPQPQFTVVSPQTPQQPPVSTIELKERLSPPPEYTPEQVEVLFQPAPTGGEPIKLPDSKSANHTLPIEILGKIRPEKVKQLRSHLETHIKPVLENDKSNYAPGRQVAWVGAKWDLKDKDFSPGVQDDRLMELIKQVYPDADIALVTYSEAPGAGINYHRDDSYAALEARSINIGNSEWGYRAAKEQMVWAKDENASALYHEFKLDSGTVTRFNCKNEHAALNTEAGRWSINIWSIKNDLGRENSVRHSFENFLASNQQPRAVIQSADDLTIKTHEWILEGDIKVERSYASLKEATRNSPQPQPLISTNKLVKIAGQPIPMNFPLMLHGEQNPLPVSTCIDAMRGHGRVHTTRAYEPYRQYGFKEGDIAIATGGGKQVAFRVGKQYQITPQMIADPQYQQQWAQMEKHSAKALPQLFTDKPQVWGLQMEPLGDYVGGKIVPFPQQVQQNPLAQLKPLNDAVAQHMKKDVAMAEVSTQFIGKSSAPASTPSSTRNYEQAWSDLSNTGNYSKSDVIMVSGSVPWRGVTNEQIQHTFDNHYRPLLDQAIAAGSSFVVGSAAGTDQLVQNYLQERGYKLENTQQGYTRASSPTVTIDHLRSWYIAADGLGKADEYKQRIVEVANEFKSTRQISPKALTAMEQDTLTRISQVSQKLASNIGQREEDGTARVNGKTYDLALNSERKDLAIAHKNGDVILLVQAGQVQVNNLTPQVLQDFETANNKLDEVFERNQKQAASLQR